MDKDSKSNRRNKRSLVLIAARLRTRVGELDVRLRNLSCNGALLEADVPPPVGAEVVFERGETIAPARVAWGADCRFGIQFLEPIEESEVLVHIGKSLKAEEPKPKRAFHRAGFRGTPPMSPLERYVGEAWFKSLNNAPLGE